MGKIREKAIVTEVKWSILKSLDLSCRTMANKWVGCLEMPSKPQVHAKTQRLSEEKLRSSSRSDVTTLSKGKDAIRWPKTAKAQTQVDRLCSSQDPRPCTVDACWAIARDMASCSAKRPRRARAQRMLAQFWASAAAERSVLKKEAFLMFANHFSQPNLKTFGRFQESPPVQSFLPLWPWERSTFVQIQPSRCEAVNGQVHMASASLLKEGHRSGPHIANGCQSPKCICNVLRPFGDQRTDWMQAAKSLKREMKTWNNRMQTTTSTTANINNTAVNHRASITTPTAAAQANQVKKARMAYPRVMSLAGKTCTNCTNIELRQLTASNQTKSMFPVLSITRQQLISEDGRQSFDGSKT